MPIINLVDETEDYDFLKKEKCDEIISELSEDLMIDNIEDQINNINKEDNSFRNSSLFQYIKERVEYIWSMEKEINGEYYKVIDNVLNRVSKSIEDKFGFNIEYSDTIPKEIKLAYIESMYNVLILKISNTTSELLSNYIMKNRDILQKEAENRITKEDKKNLSYKGIKFSYTGKYTELLFFLDDFIKEIDIQDSIEIIDLFTQGEETEIFNYNLRKLLVENQYGDVTFDKPLCDIFKNIILNRGPEVTRTFEIVDKICKLK